MYNNNRMHGTATVLREVPDSIHISTEPNTGLFDHKGEVIPKRGLMARLDAKVQEQVTLSKGTLWLLGAGVVIINLAFMFGGSLLSWARDDQTQRLQLQQVQTQASETRNDVKDLNTKFDAIQKMLTEQAIKDAETKGKEFGYGVGRKDGKDGH
jgi:hypothetical protein